MELNAITRFDSFVRLPTTSSAARARPLRSALRRTRSATSVSSTVSRRSGDSSSGGGSARARERGRHQPLHLNAWVQRRVRRITWRRLLRTCLGGLWKGAASGYSLRIAFKLLPILVATVRTGSWRLLPGRLRRMVVNGVGEARFGLFVGAIVATLRLVLLITRAAGLNAAALGSVVGGVLAGACSLILPPGSRSSLGLFFGVRAVEVVVTHLVRVGLLPSIPHADTLLMMLSSGEILWAWIWEPHTLDRSYNRFLNHHGGHPRRVLDFLAKGQDVTRGGHLHWPDVRSHWAELGRQVVQAPSVANLTCEVRHPGHSCTVHLLSYFAEGFVRAVKVYLPVHLIPLVVFGLARLRSDPLGSTQHVLWGIIRSSTFLTSYCTWAWALLCVQRQFLGIQSHHVGFTCGMAGGAAVILEKKSRRIELALYVTGHAIESTWNLWKQYGWVRPLPLGAAALFGAAVTVLLQAYMVAPHLMRRSYVSATNWLFLWPKDKPKMLSADMAPDSPVALPARSPPVRASAGAAVGSAGAADGSQRARIRVIARRHSHAHLQDRGRNLDTAPRGVDSGSAGGAVAAKSGGGGGLGEEGAGWATAVMRSARATTRSGRLGAMHSEDATFSDSRIRHVSVSPTSDTSDGERLL